MDADDAMEKRDKIEQKMLELEGRKLLYSRTKMVRLGIWIKSSTRFDMIRARYTDKTTHGWNLYRAS